MNDMQKYCKLIDLLKVLEDLDLSCKTGELTMDDMPKMRAVLEAYTSWPLAYSVVQWLEETIDAITVPKPDAPEEAEAV